LPAGSTLSVERPEIFNDGKFLLDSHESMDEAEWTPGWGGDQEVSSKSELDSLFPNGTYTVNFGSHSVSLSLEGDLYPPTPLAILSGGAWANGTYIVDPTKAVSVTLNPPAGFGTHVEDRVGIDIDYGRFSVERMASENGSTAPLSLTIPAGTLSAGQEIWIQLEAN